jgi:hypothetical protein
MSVASFFHLLRTALMAACAATIVAQAVGVGILSSQGALTRDKIARYAAVIYGFDPRDLPTRANAPQAGQADSAPTSRDAMVARRAEKDTLFANRLKALKSDSADVQSRLLTLQENHNQYESAEKLFEARLDQLERDADTSALQEVQLTLETLQAKQAKEVIVAMLKDEHADATDDVLSDVVTIVKSMSQDKLKKIFAEFKSESERQTLHRILVEIGEVATRQRWEPNS